MAGHSARLIGVLAHGRPFGSPDRRARSWQARLRWQSVEQLGPEGFALPVVMLPVVIGPALRPCTAVVVFVDESRGALDDLVEFASVEPDAAALLAEIDLDPLTIADHQLGLTARAFHSGGLPPESAA